MAGGNNAKNRLGRKAEFMHGGVTGTAALWNQRLKTISWVENKL